MIPLDGPIRDNVGLLGSPPFEIPRTVHRGASSGPIVDLGERRRRRRLAAKNRHNARTIATVLFLRWIQFFVVVLVVGTAADFYGDVGVWAIPAALLLIPLFSSVYSALLERAVLGFRALRPRFCSIYDRYFWGHERLWKFYTRPIFVGTPFNTLLWRLAGVRIGRRVLDDGCVLPEKSLTAIGDDTVLNAGSVVQCHSLEDGVFTSDHSTIGTGCTVGVGAFVHYGVTMGDGAELAADAYLMKGEEVAPATRWLGNPASSATGAPLRRALPPADSGPAEVSADATRR
jgi:non-ribosomal peptide synthetase-like protein